AGQAQSPGKVEVPSDRQGQPVHRPRHRIDRPSFPAAAQANAMLGHPRVLPRRSRGQERTVPVLSPPEGPAGCNLRCIVKGAGNGTSGFWFDSGFGLVFTAWTDYSRVFPGATERLRKATVESEPRAAGGLRARREREGVPSPRSGRGP